MKTTKLNCPHCKEVRDFEYLEGKSNRKFTCLDCGCELYTKDREDIAFMFGLIFPKKK